MSHHQPGNMAVNILICLLRRDLRFSDNPIFHRLASTSDHGFTHFLPVYVFSADQIEVSGFLTDGSASPYPEARSKVSKVWRTGPHRAKFIAECVFDLKGSLESAESGLLVRVGKPGEVIADLVEGLLQKHQKVGAVWMTKEEGVEECNDQKAIAEICTKRGADLCLFEDEKYYVDE